MSAPTNLHAVFRPNLGRAALSLIVLALSLVVFLFALPSGSGLRPAWAQTGTFSFTFAGDFGTGSGFTANLNKITQSGSAFFAANGDLGYGGSGAEASWCTSVKNVVGATFPFEILVGNHDDDSSGAHIRSYTPCLPDRLGVTGDYGVEYYVDYGNARLIMAAPNMTVDGIAYNYNVAGTHRTWITDRIREAKAAGKWVIVGAHENCITAATKSCSIGESFMDLIHTEGVDLFMQGHDHTYQRSKQLSCANSGAYTSSCVVDSDNSYIRGAGTVTVINGLGGNGQYNINASDIERDYFVKAMGGNGNWNFVTGATNTGREYGIVKVTVSSSQLDVVWLPSQVTVAGFTGDSFSIVGTGGSTPAPPTATRTSTPMNTPMPPPSTPTPSGSSTTLSFQNGVLPSTSYTGNVDTMIKQGSASSNFGSATALEVDGDDGSGVDKSILIKWDASAIPVGKTVTAATITFRVLDGSGSAYQLYELKRNWVESQATWNIFSTGNNWQTAGAFGANDRGSTVLGAIGSTTINTFYTITLNASGRAVVQNWVNNPGVNFGFIIANASSADGLDFSSSEASTTTYHPKLTVTYQ